MPDHGVVEERRWELRPVRRWSTLGGGLLPACIWLPIEAGLLFFTGFLAVVVPYAVELGDRDAALRWLGVPFGSVAGMYAAFCTALGWMLWRWVVANQRRVVVVVDGRDIRTERDTRRGRRVDLDLAWGDVRAADVRPGRRTMRLHGTRGTTELASVGDADQHQRILRHVNERLAELPERPPVVRGHTAYLDDRGATLIESRRTGLLDAAWTGALAVLCAVNAASLALVAEAPGAGGVGWIAAGGGAVALWLAAVTAASLRWRPRWIARPGTVVLEPRLGGGFAFEARSLEFVRQEGEGGVGYRLVAVKDAGGAKRSRRKTILAASADGDPDALLDTGTWLARHAEIPLRHVEITPDTP